MCDTTKKNWMCLDTCIHCKHLGSNTKSKQLNLRHQTCFVWSNTFRERILDSIAHKLAYIPRCAVCQQYCGPWSPSSQTSRIWGATQCHGAEGFLVPLASNPPSHPPARHCSEKQSERERQIWKQRTEKCLQYLRLANWLKHWPFSQKKQDICATRQLTQYY